MAQQTADLKVSPSKEIIRVGPPAVRFPITGDWKARLRCCLSFVLAERPRF